MITFYAVVDIHGITRVINTTHITQIIGISEKTTIIKVQNEEGIAVDKDIQTVVNELTGQSKRLVV